MLSWLQNNIATILISAALLAVIGAIVYGMIRAKKQGRSSCGCSCAGCGGCCSSCSGSAHRE